MSDSARVIQGYRASTGLSHGEVTADPGESCQGRVELDQESDGGEDMAATSVDSSFWNLGWD